MNQLDTCVIADDHPLMREILRVRLEAAGIDVIGEACNGEEAVQLIRSMDPTIALIDVNMPGLDGIGVITRMAEQRSRTRSIVFTGGARQHDVERALGAGARGFLDKGADTELFAAALSAVLAGERFVDPLVAGRMYSQSHAPISPREHQVLELLAEGLQNKEIAVRLVLSTETIKVHVTSLMTKLDVHNRAGAVAAAFREGLIS